MSLKRRNNNNNNNNKKSQNANQKKGRGTKKTRRRQKDTPVRLMGKVVFAARVKAKEGLEAAERRHVVPFVEAHVPLQGVGKGKASCTVSRRPRHVTVSRRAAVCPALLLLFHGN